MLSFWPSTLCHVYNPAQYSCVISCFKSPLLRKWHNFSSPSIHQIATPTSLQSVLHQIICLSCAHRSLKLLNDSIFVPPQPPSTRCSTVSARYVRPSHLRCRWTNDIKLVPKQFAWAGHANWLFSSYTEDVSFWSVLGRLSALEAFCDDVLY